MNVFAILKWEMDLLRCVSVKHLELENKKPHTVEPIRIGVALNLVLERSIAKKIIFLNCNKKTSFLQRCLLNLDLPRRLFNQFNSPFVHELKKQTKAENRGIHSVTFTFEYC